MPDFDTWSAFELVFLKGNENLLMRPFVATVIDRGSYRGGYLGKVAKGLSAEQYAKLKPPMEVESLSHAHPLQAQALESLISSLSHFDTQVFFVETPMPRPISEAPGLVAAKEEIGARISAAGYVFVNGDLLVDNSDPTLFADSSHLSTEGRRVYTEAIMERIRPYVSADSAPNPEGAPSGP